MYRVRSLGQSLHGHRQVWAPPWPCAASWRRQALRKGCIHGLLHDALGNVLDVLLCLCHGVSVLGRSLPELGRSASRTPPPWSCPSSDPLWCAAFSRTGPRRRLAVHGARTGVAPSASWRVQRVRHAHVLLRSFGQRGSRRPHEGLKRPGQLVWTLMMMMEMEIMMMMMTMIDTKDPRSNDVVKGIPHC